MRAADLALDELLEFQRDGGILRFAGQRAMVLDTNALGLLRKELVATLGLDPARGVLTRFGYAHGWQTAQTLERALPWSTIDEWRQAGGRLHRLQGVVNFEPVHETQRASPPAFAEAIWRDSYEVEQHLAQFGEADEPVCWSISGFASGYLSRAYGRPIFCVETQCQGCGDAVCRMRCEERDYFVENGLERQLRYFEQRELDDAIARVRTTLRKLERQLRARRRALDDNPLADAESPGLVARSPAMRAVLDLGRRVAPVDSPVLITGPTGVGKDRVARFIHDHSNRAGGPYIAVNCAALPEALLESELFGHAKGAFSGATRDRIGLFEAAHTGSLLLDEIGELAPTTQTRLLRVLKDREVRRVGEDTARSVDVRILAATRHDLGQELERGRFREELLYQLRVVELRIPALRERPDDVLPLAHSMLGDANERLGRAISGFSPTAAEALLAYDWPGNERELQNAIERAVALGRGNRIEPEDLPRLESKARKSGVDAKLDLGEEIREHAVAHHRLNLSLDAVEREHILSVLDACNGNKAEAARRLEIGTATLFRKLRRYRGA